jgi:hypothetical protein
MGKTIGLADPTRLKPFAPDAKQMLPVVIETPKGSRNKFAFNSDEHIFAPKILSDHPKGQVRSPEKWPFKEPSRTLTAAGGRVTSATWRMFLNNQKKQQILAWL